MRRCVIDDLSNTFTLAVNSSRQNMGMQSALETIIFLAHRALACYSQISPDTRTLGPGVDNALR